VSVIPTPDKRTGYSSRRADRVEEAAWPVFDEEGRGLLESVGDVIRPGRGELLWDAGDPYDLYLVCTGELHLIDRRDGRVSFVVEAGDFVGELGMLMGQPAFLAGIAAADSTLLRVRITELRRLMATSTELSDVLPFDNPRQQGIHGEAPRSRPPRPSPGCMLGAVGPVAPVGVAVAADLATDRRR
jgi:thioredoxin reductase (NADPH)